MGMSQEEISVKLGVDHKALNSGMETAGNTVKSWVKKRKTDEEEYTQFWKRELDKRTAADVEAASRAIQARRLLRQRAATREARINQEVGGGTLQESIRKATQEGGDEAGDSFGEHFTHKFQKKFSKQMFHLIIATLLGNIEQRWDELTKWMAEKLYSSLNEANERVAKTLEARNKELHGIREQQIKSPEEFEKRRAEAQYEMADEAGKYAILDAKRTENRQKRAALDEQLSRADAEETKVPIQAEINKLLVENFDIAEKISGVNEKMAEEKKKEREEEKNHNAQQLADSIKRGEILSAQDRRVQTAQANLEQGIKDPLMFTIGDLAQDNTNWGSRARDYQQNIDWAKWNVRHGNFGLAGEQKRRADDIMDNLKKENPFLVNPLEKLTAEAKQQNATLGRMLTDGIPIKTGE